MNFVHKFRLIIYNLQSRKSGFGVSTRTMKERLSPKTPLLLQGRPHHRSIHVDSACVLEKTGTKNMHIFIKVGPWGRLRGERLILKHVFALYSLPIIFSKICSFATLARLRFILHLKMQTCNVLYQPHLYIFLSFWCHYF